ncbi:DUF805 domain-containing protein [Mycolicibacterium conceptionense]|uniref:DUF805 domain-containing protein n=1 Tax=Mycolicibacterium conceptionense TaxID=451644 RepID=UPI00096F8EEF|nr:suppressor of fused domain protein [Mycolicibacterium conceptionense]OMB86406.1 hypothetical protein A5743_26275 [Mycolicibacterium conceptionense]
MTRSEETPSQPVGATDPSDLTLPLYAATFGQAVSRFVRSYARFSGRASRSEYWWVVMAFAAVAILSAALAAAVGDDSALGPTFRVIAVVFVLACVVPSSALLARRLQDADRSRWLALLIMVPYIGFVFLIVVGVLPSKPHREQFDHSTSAASDGDESPGWDAIDAALARLYPGLDGAAPHFGRTDARLPGEGIWGITAYPNTSGPQPHWHLVTYGFSNVFESDPSSDEHDIWADFEWTFRVAADIDLTQPLAPQVPTWAVLLLQRLGDLVFSGSEALDVGHRIQVGGPITLGEPRTELTAIMFGKDPQLGQIDTGFGALRFVQLVGVTADTVAAAQSLGDGVDGTLEMLERMAGSNPLLVTDIKRGAHLT